MDYYSIVKKTHENCCSCCLAINWNIEAIALEEDDGFIVQEFKRRLIPSTALDEPKYQDISYFEAWRVRDGTIIEEDKGNPCNDIICIGHPLDPLGEFKKSVNTKGRFEFEGTVYWIPRSSNLFEIVDNWSRTEVEQANGLKATFQFKEIIGAKPITSRPTFVHEWDLSNEQKVYKAAKDSLFRCCPNNTQTDRNILKETIEELLPENYDAVKRRVIEEWEMQWE